MDIEFVDDSLCDELFNLLAGLGNGSVDWNSEIEDRLSDGSVKIGPNGTPEDAFSGGIGSLLLGPGGELPSVDIPPRITQPQPDPEPPEIPVSQIRLTLVEILLRL